MFKFIPSTQIAYEKMVARGVVDDSVEDIIELIIDQEVVSYATENGMITFDPADIDRGDDQCTCYGCSTMRHECIN